MPPLYIVQQNTKFRINNRRLQVERDEVGKPSDVLVSVPLGQVSQVVLFGNIGLTTPAIDALLLQETEVIFLSESGQFRGRLVGNTPPHVMLRRAQYERLNNPAFTLEVAKGFVTAKITHQRALLARHNRELGDELIASAIAELNRALDEVPRKMGVSSLRGLEGAATAAYFSGYRRLFDPGWEFNDRNRRPPADPVNLLLSLGYTLLAELAASAVQAAGFDPFAGFLHEVAYNRPALGLDLMEEFRPIVDGVVLWACRSRQVRPEDFTEGPPDRPVLLLEDGKKRYIQAFEQRMNQPYTHPLRNERLPMRQCLLEQAHQLSRMMLSGHSQYTGMGFR